MNRCLHCLAVMTAALVATGTHAGELSDNIRIDSQQLGYTLQYRVYTPSPIDPGKQYPVLLVTDGQWYLDDGGMADVLDSMIADGAITPAYVVFVDSRNPDRLEENRRTSEFMCKVPYANFYTAELLPTLYEQYPISVRREDTNVLGLSFGGLNSACFGALASPRFSGIGMHSPASDRHLEAVFPLYRDWDQEPLRVYISAGTRGDNLRAARKLAAVLEEDGHAVTLDVNRGASHDWGNWRVMLDDALLTLLGPGRPPEP
ncbi:esterase family protein [Marinihelvus fidelis]|uniref:Esterase family protein n=1 Tax=Marinihelvus fidelis TaxID=2613842 RepID=A0A5N0TCG7_9GAMM|nr:alpha/beta hydrolase-fold protein [Marinihelvus fidelis]KAA9132705.1 esterase family protein [Marinihelvus fidelis]